MSSRLFALCSSLFTFAFLLFTLFSPYFFTHLSSLTVLLTSYFLLLLPVFQLYACHSLKCNNVINNVINNGINHCFYHVIKLTKFCRNKKNILLYIFLFTSSLNIHFSLLLLFTSSHLPSPLISHFSPLSLLPTSYFFTHLSPLISLPTTYFLLLTTYFFRVTHFGTLFSRNARIPS